MKQKMLNELFNAWLQEQLKEADAKQPVEIKKSA